MLALLLAAALCADPTPLAPEAARDDQNPKAPVPAAPASTTVSDARLWPDARPVGPYGQPEWTDRRHFPGTRVYVAPPGATFEYWVENKTPFDGEDLRWRGLFELSFGLGHRLQLDLYLTTVQFGEQLMSLEAEKVELRYAFADWGKLPGNPTLYLEWTRQAVGPMRGEVKLLLGGDLTDRLYWGFNFFFERDLYGGAQSQEYGVNGGLSYSLLASKLSLGAELQVELEDVKHHHGDPDSIEILLGPSVAWRPVPSAHLLLVWFVGPAIERSSPAIERSSPTVDRTAHSLMQPTLVFGWRF